MNDLVYDREFFRDGWSGGLPETPCGYGSKLSQTVRQRDWIPELVKKYNIKTISDIGAGDLNWIRFIEFPKYVEYQAYDLVPRHKRVITFDLMARIPPKTDLILCLWVLNHFDELHTIKAIDNIKKSESKYLLVTQRYGYYHPDFKVLEVLTLNEKRDVMLFVKL